MLPDVALEALGFFDRAALERLQMHSSYLRDFVNRHARSLPLRYIDEVWTAYGNVYIRLLKDDEDKMRVAVPGGDELESLFHCVNNAFIRLLRLGFLLEELPFPYYLRANADDLQCHVKALCMQGLQEEDDAEHISVVEIDYALVDFVCVHLKPDTCEIWRTIEKSEDYLMRFTHDVLRGRIKHLVFALDEDPAPGSIIPELFGVDPVDTCAITTHVNPGPWIRKFVEKFEMAERGTDCVRSVTLLQLRYDDDAPWGRIAEPLGQPRLTDAQTPSSAFIKEWSREILRDGVNKFTESTVAELLEFESAALAKKLEVLVWTVEQGYDYEGTYCLDFLRYAFLLQVADL